jgi:hypothetical protein
MDDDQNDDYQNEDPWSNLFEGMTTAEVNRILAEQSAEAARHVWYWPGRTCPFRCTPAAEAVWRQMEWEMSDFLMARSAETAIDDSLEPLFPDLRLDASCD